MAIILTKKQQDDAFYIFIVCNKFDEETYCNMKAIHESLANSLNDVGYDLARTHVYNKADRLNSAIGEEIY